MNLFPDLKKFVLSIKTNDNSAVRKEILMPLIEFIQHKVDLQEPIRLNFICTHNSRRSHFAQVWAQTMADFFGVKNVFCYSGGTEATALYPLVLETLSQNGFRITELAPGQNSVNSIKFSENDPGIIGFSKEWNNTFNPKNHFAAVLTCSQADVDCPFIPGAEKRISIPFEDPKLYDDSGGLQSQKYKETNKKIASELYYVFSKIICK